MQSELNRGQVDYILHQYGINKEHPRRKGYSFTQEQLAEMAKMYNDGEPLRAIIKKFGIKTRSSVAQILRRYKVKLDRPKKIAAKKGVRTNDRVDQLCWKCAKAVGRCSWTDRTFTPIEGWTATEVYRDGVLHTYSITACPEFEEG